MRPIDEIIVHATATKPDFMPGATTAARVAEVKRWHVEDNGWSDIGYHFLIDRDGTVATGRPVEVVGAHVSGHNTGTIGVSLFGGHGSAATDAFSDHFTPEQERSLLDLLSALGDKYGVSKITGHNQYAAKACPGFNVTDWLKGAPAPSTDNDVAGATESQRYRWRIAELSDMARAMQEKADAALRGE